MDRGEVRRVDEEGVEMVCSKCKEERSRASFRFTEDDPLRQICNVCKEVKVESLTLEKEWRMLVGNLYTERRRLKERIEHIDMMLKGLEAEGVLRVNKERMGEV